MTLRKVQETFKDTMLQPLSGLETLDQSLYDIFQEGHIPLQERLKVYHNNVIGNISNALFLTFPLIEKLVGEDFLRSMLRAFVMDHPPQSGCLHHYGKSFDKFIENFSAAKSLPYLPDMARFELAINDAYYAQDDKPLGADELSKIPTEHLGDSVLKLRHSAFLIKSDYPVLALRDFCLNPENTPPDLTLTSQHHTLILRPTFDVQMIPLNAAEYTMLSRLETKETLSKAIEAAFEIDPDFDFSAFLQKHLTLQTFSAI